VIDDSSENYWVWQTANSVQTGFWWWIGYNNINAQFWEEPSGGWSWVNGSSSSYTNWASGQPDDYWSSEDCAHLYDSSDEWNDLDCGIDNWYGSYVYYICEESP
jgi:hypothetical protein